MPIMGKVFSALSRPFRNYNVGNRAAKRIAQEKPKPAPRHPSTVKYLQDAVDSPTSKEATKIPEEYLTRLKQVYVTSRGPAADSESDTSKRKLPKARETVYQPEFGFVEPAVIPTGKVTMRQAIELLIRHQGDPSKWTPEMIAKEYKLDFGLTQQMLLFFRAYDLWEPPKSVAGAKPQQQSASKYIIPPKQPLPHIK